MSDREPQVDYSQWRHVASASQYEAWELCKRKWWFRSVIKMPKQRKESTDFGDTMHEVLERWLGADDSGRDETGKPVDLYPAGWDKLVSPANAAQIKALVNTAIEQGVIVRRPGRVVEAGFVREVAPGLAIQGYLDLSFPNDLEIQDHKTTKKRAYAKTPEQLKRNPQMLVYAKVVMDAAGAGPNAVLKLRHNTFVRQPARVMQIGPVEVNGEAVLKFWDEEIVPTVKDMATLKEKGFTEEQWRQVPGPVDEDEACRAFGGCEYLSVCSGRQSSADLRRSLTGLSFTTTTPPGDTKVASVMDKLLAAGRGTTAVAAAPTTAASAPAPATAQPSQPAPSATAATATVVGTVQPPVLAAAAVVPPPAFKAPPWAQSTCQSCKGRGFAKTGQPCFPCSSMTRASRPDLSPDGFTIQILPDGIVLWRNANGDVKGDQKIEGWTAPKTEVREPEQAPAKQVVQVAQPAGGALAKLAAAAGTAATVAPATAPAAVPAVPAAAPVEGAAAPAAEPAKRGRGRPRKTIALPPAPIAGAVAEAAASVSLDKNPDGTAMTQSLPLTTESVTSGASTVPTMGEPMDGHVDKEPRTGMEARALEKAVEMPKAAPAARAPSGFVLIIGATQIGGTNVSQVSSRDLSNIVVERLAPLVEQALGKKWFQMPVYERRDALVQRAREISQTLSGVVTVNPNESEVAALAHALIPFADGAFIASR